MRFAVRVLVDAGAKHATTQRQRRSGANPFLPFEPALFVADVSETHVALLNKFPVLPHHALLVTRAFEPQETPLTRADHEALWRALAQWDAVGFYNAGPAAGASQPHRHLQVLPAPLGRGPERGPVERAFAGAPRDGSVGRAPGLPFRHALARADARAALADALAGRPPEAAAEASRELAAELLRAVGRDPAAPGAYNMVWTREWALAVPRTRPGLPGLPVNALAYAGALFARDEDALSRLRARGPFALLRDAGEPAHEGKG